MSLRKVSIKDRWSEAELYAAEVEAPDDATARRLALVQAVAARAYLSGAYLSGADLSGAYLSGADLSGADLSGADLSGASGIDANRTTPLRILLEQPGDIHAYKLVSATGDSPISDRGTLHYEIGASLEVADADTDESVECSRGIHVATLDWVMREWSPGRRILVVRFTAKDIAAIPTATDGKFRLYRCTVVGEKDTKALGLGVEPSKPEEAKLPAEAFAPEPPKPAVPSPKKKAKKRRSKKKK